MTSKDLIVEFYRLSNHDIGPMCVYSSTSKRVPLAEDVGTVVADVVEIIPSVDENKTMTSLSSDSNKLTIHGRGFDAYEPTNNVMELSIQTRTMPLTYSSNSTTSVDSVLVASSSISRTHLILTFCVSSSPPAESSSKCSLLLTDHGNMVRFFGAFTFYDLVHLSNSHPLI